MRIVIDGNRARPVLLGLLVVAALVAVTVLTTALRLGGGAEQAAAQESSVAVSLDMDTSDGPCTDIDGAISHATGDIYSVAICVTGLYQGYPIGSFTFDVLYDDTLNIAPEVADAEQALDDNPDANAGATTWGDGLGTDWDCSASGMSYPTGDANPATGPANGQAYLTCDSLNGPYTLGDNETAGVIAVINFAAIAAGTDTMAIAESGYLAYPDVSKYGECDPNTDYPMACNGGTDTNQGGPVPVPTSGPGPIAPPVVPPPVVPPAPPIGVPVPVIVAPPTGSGPAGDGSPWTALGWLLVGAVGTAIAAGGLLRLARGRQR
jgi:hypothetical protein